MDTIRPSWWNGTDNYTLLEFNVLYQIHMPAFWWQPYYEYLNRRDKIAHWFKNHHDEWGEERTCQTTVFEHCPVETDDKVILTLKPNWLPNLGGCHTVTHTQPSKKVIRNGPRNRDESSPRSSGSSFTHCQLTKSLSLLQMSKPIMT